MDGMNRLRAGFVDLWCGWTHGGGHILRDPSGRVNWQCKKCGRWADPVSEGDEANLLKQHMAQASAKPTAPIAGPSTKSDAK